MALIGKTRADRYFGQRQLSAGKQFLRSLDPTMQYVAVRRHALRSLEGPGEVTDR